MPLHTNLTPGVGSKGQECFPLKVVMLHIKWKGMKHKTIHKQIFIPYQLPDMIWVWVNRSNIEIVWLIIFLIETYHFDTKTKDILDI